jgi:L-threonylcarbamoyladenylate synthase
MSASHPANVQHASAEAIARGAAILRRGGLVAFPTETVYGLGANAADDRAVAAIFAAKKRPRFNPLIVHVRDLAHAREFAVFSPAAEALATAFWPGALTLVLPCKPGATVSLLASAGLHTIALRVPSHPVARALLASAGIPIAAPSANPSGRISPTSAAHVAEGLGGEVEMILDGGPAQLGLESTVISLEAERVLLLRPGAIARGDIEAIAGPLAAAPANVIVSPGQLNSHYAPRAGLRMNANMLEPGEALLAFGPRIPSGGQWVRNLSATGDLQEAAANLFAMLRELDALSPDCIAAMPIPLHGLGEAINDRLRRAAAPRDD